MQTVTKHTNSHTDTVTKHTKGQIIAIDEDEATEMQSLPISLIKTTN